MEDGITFRCFLVSLLHSSLLFGSRPGIYSVGMDFYNLPMEVEYPHAPDPPKGRHWAVPIGSPTYDFV